MGCALEVKVYNFLKPLRGKNFLLAVSGGRDSMALLKVFETLAPKLQIQFTVGHVHHGASDDLAQVGFRNECYEYLKNHCQRRKIPFVCNVEQLSEMPALRPLKNSEAEYRRHRQTCFKAFAQHTHYDFIVFAHHQEDLFETRLIRMLRGTGPQGLVAMSLQNGRVLRPFLQTAKSELRAYLGDGVFFEDPSNNSTRYLRNWLRKTWLPLLEKQRPGAVRSFQQSLSLCLEALQTVPSLAFCFDDKMQVLRSEYTGLSSAEKKRVWAQYLKQIGVKNYGLSHINELVKRLDVEQKDLTFILLKKRWLANARHIWCESKNTLE
jgi:tRNA(Ile)-lysidine synthase